MIFKWLRQESNLELIKGSIEILSTEGITEEELEATIEIILKPALDQVDDMTLKEEEILFPMAIDKLTKSDWYEISKQR